MRSGHAIPSFAAFVRLCMNTASNVLGKVFLSTRVKHEKELTVLLSDKESSLKTLDLVIHISAVQNLSIFRS